MTVRIKDIGKVVTGKTPTTKREDYFVGDIPFITPSDITNGGVINDSERHISQQGLGSIKNNSISGTSVLVGCIGSDMGNVGITYQTCATNQQINSITNIKDSYCPEYIYYRLSLLKSYFHQIANSTTTPLLPKSDFENIQLVDLPDYETQKRIASVLSNIDRKIALNRAMNEELEQTARDLYDYWFLQFDFPDANGKPYRSSGGKMIYNPQLKREIPEGWEVLKVANLSQPNKRTSNGKFSTSFQYLDISNITENHIEELQKLDPCVDNIPSRARRLVTEGDIVYSTVRPNLRHYGLLYNPIENMVVSTGFAVLTSIWSGYRYYLYQFLSHPMIVNKLHTIAQLSVSAYPSISVNDILELDILVPSKDIVDKYAEFCNNVYAQMDIQEKEIVHLRSLRDELLPLLMNGQVEVKE